MAKTEQLLQWLSWNPVYTRTPVSTCSYINLAHLFFIFWQYSDFWPYNNTNQQLCYLEQYLFFCLFVSLGKLSSWAEMSYMLPHLHNGWQVDQAILSEEDRVLVIRFGHDWDPTCMKMDEVLYSIAEKVHFRCTLYTETGLIFQLSVLRFTLHSDLRNSGAFKGKVHSEIQYICEKPLL